MSFFGPIATAFHLGGAERANVGNGREDLHAATRGARSRRSVSFACVGTPRRAPSRTTAPLIESISVGAPLRTSWSIEERVGAVVRAHTRASAASNRSE